MADGMSELVAGAAKLVLDDVTGDMVSRNELKKRTQKRAKKAAADEARARKAAEGPTASSAANVRPKQPAASDQPPEDPDAIFRQGFLADVFKERPTKPVVTRFPPEPNGYLHLGHAKAIAVDFGFARYHGGDTILRFDDTNPNEEDQVYFDAIEDIIKWLGFTPSRVTYSSDNFQRLYDLAEKLIGLNKAYVCHCTQPEIQLSRGGKDGKEGPRYRCKHAEQDPDTNLAKFRDMRDGKYGPQTATLRMKQDIENSNPQMWDITAYRILEEKKKHIRDPNWKMYPTESYEWLNKTLEVYEPMQREFGTVMSKRVLKALVEKKIVRGWDDPRLYTLIALRRRGVPPGAILSFINELGVTTARTFIQVERFEQSVRRYLEQTVPRLMLVLDPIPVTIQDHEETLELDAPFSPKDPSLGTHKLAFTKTIYIDRSDFRSVDGKSYYRLAPGKTVGLLQGPSPIRAVSYTKDEATGKVTGIQAVFDKTTKPKAYIQWVPEGSMKAEARVYAPLFNSENPMAAEGGFLNDINPDSETIYANALVEAAYAEVRQRAPWPATAGEKQSDAGPETVRFQALRVGYFAVDSDTTAEKVVLNQIVPLKEDSGKSH
ncbi:glutaminyl-tRNA synthetase [Cordyceps javanica]|uniref:glutamine--tRNA ligase n=1 Tax=Cordyceps javanica TaxID=43265 RepID=A0A545WCE9_9HYPO|nr:glutaminyl-tRNA synthetase [Cordyceps javanica]TQW11626.1 glutaminyl-tRNA synthetase [Cordyceps javanica]